MVRASAKMHRTTFYRIGYLPTNDTIARFTPNDLDKITHFKYLGNRASTNKI